MTTKWLGQVALTQPLYRLYVFRPSFRVAFNVWCFHVHTLTFVCVHLHNTSLHSVLAERRVFFGSGTGVLQSAVARASFVDRTCLAGRDYQSPLFLPTKPNLQRSAPLASSDVQFLCKVHWPVQSVTRRAGKPVLRGFADYIVWELFTFESVYPFSAIFSHSS